MKFRVSLLVLTAILGALTLLPGCDPRVGDLEFTLTFKQAKGLRPGQFITYKGVRIGEVRSVDVDASGVVRIDVKVNEKYRQRVYKEAVFKIEKLSMINPTGEHQVTMNDAGRSRTPIENGTIVAGTDGRLEEVVGKVKEELVGKARDVAKTAAEGVANVVERAVEGNQSAGK